MVLHIIHNILYLFHQGESFIFLFYQVGEMFSNQIRNRWLKTTAGSNSALYLKQRRCTFCRQCMFVLCPAPLMYYTCTMICLVILAMFYILQTCPVIIETLCPPSFTIYLLPALSYHSLSPLTIFQMGENYSYLFKRSKSSYIENIYV